MPISTEKYRSTDISGDYAAMARAFGGYGERVTTPDEIIPAIKRGIEQTRAGHPGAARVHHLQGDGSLASRDVRRGTGGRHCTKGGIHGQYHYAARRARALGAGAAAATLVDFKASAIPIANVEPPNLPIEKGATLRVLRPTKFVDPDEVIFRENIKKFTDTTGVAIRVDFVGWEDLRPQTAVAANTGAGPDVVIGWPDDPHLYADKLIEVSDIAEYLGKKYGGWYFLAEKYGKKLGHQQLDRDADGRLRRPDGLSRSPGSRKPGSTRSRTISTSS